VATGKSVLTTPITHALLADPAARYTDLGAGCYEQRMHARRQARNHVRSPGAPATRSPSRSLAPIPASPSPRPADPPPPTPALTRLRALPPSEERVR
jgi:hypothetical protein